MPITCKPLLLEKRKEILRNVLSMESEALGRERTDLSHVPLHMGDVGSDAFEIETGARREQAASMSAVVATSVPLGRSGSFLVSFLRLLPCSPSRTDDI